MFCDRGVVVSNKFDGEGDLADICLAFPHTGAGVIRDVALVEYAVGATVSRDDVMGVSPAGAPFAHAFAP